MKYQPSTSAGRTPPADAPPEFGEAPGAPSTGRYTLGRSDSHPTAILDPQGRCVAAIYQWAGPSIDALLAAANRPASTLNSTYAAMARDCLRDAIDLVEVAVLLRTKGLHLPTAQLEAIQGAMIEAIQALGKAVGS